jgi:argininosuccinate lyase
MEIMRGRIEMAIEESFIQATEVAEYLVKKGIPFREAHRIVGTIVKECDRRGTRLQELKIEELKAFSPFFDEDVYEVMDPKRIVELRKTIGGASIGEVVAQIEREKLYLSS